MPPVGELGDDDGETEQSMKGSADASAVVPAGEASDGRHDAMSEEDLLDDSWADGLRPRRVAKGTAAGAQECKVAKGMGKGVGGAAAAFEGPCRFPGVPIPKPHTPLWRGV